MPRPASFFSVEAPHGDNPGASITWVPRVAYAHPCAIRVVAGSDVLVKGQYSVAGLARVATDSGYDFSRMRAAHLFNNRGGRFFKTVEPDHLGRRNATYYRMLAAALGDATLARLRAAYAGCPAVAEAPCAPPGAAPFSQQNP